MAEKTIIVTGGAGFIGSNFVYHMLKKYPNYRIVCLDALTYAGNLSTLKQALENPNFRFVKADICDKKAVEDLFSEEHPDIWLPYDLRAPAHGMPSGRALSSREMRFSLILQYWYPLLHPPQSTSNLPLV